MSYIEEPLHTEAHNSLRKAKSFESLFRLQSSITTNFVCLFQNICEIIISSFWLRELFRYDKLYRIADLFRNDMTYDR